MSRRMLRTGLLAVLLMPCFGQGSGTVADSDTFGMSNGRLWNQLPKGGKLVYLTGLRDSVVWKLQEKELSDEEYRKEVQQEWADRFTVGEYILVLDELYKQPENILIPIPMAMKLYCTAKLTGTWKVGDLENLVMKIRRAAADSDPSASPPATTKP